MSASKGGTAAAAAMADFLTLNEEIAAIVRARLPLESQLGGMGRELPGKAGALAERIGRRLEAGETLDSAIDAECASLPSAYRAVIVGGAQSGDLSAALKSLVSTATRLEQLRRVTGIAILYPLVIVVVASLLLALVISQVVPNFEWLNQSHFGLLHGLADWRYTMPVFVVVVPCAAVLWAAVWWRRSGKVGHRQFAWNGRLAWLSGVRRVHYWSQAATFVELLKLLIEGGVPLQRAIRLAGDASGKGPLRETAARLSQQIDQGSPIRATGPGASESAASEFPLLVRVALHHADNRVLLARGLKQAAAMYRDRADRAAEWYIEYMPMLLTVAVGGTLTIAFALIVLWPYASTLHELSGWDWR